MRTSYKNPWHNPRTGQYGPPVYETNVKPVHYKGYQIYQRIEGAVWDVVKDGVCVTQMAGPRSARRYVDDRQSD
jgi:hypothetical protein